jgi:hypothetical protein
MVLRTNVFLLLGTSLVLCFGCSGSVKYPATSAVSGKVTLQGKPLADAQVVFQSKEGGARAASGTTDASGNYRLTTFKKDDGAVPGSYQVTVAKASAAKLAEAQAAANSAPSNDPAMAMKSMMTAPKGAKKAAEESEVPAKYGSVKTSGLEKTVTKDGPNNFDFDLQ